MQPTGLHRDSGTPLVAGNSQAMVLTCVRCIGVNRGGRPGRLRSRSPPMPSAANRSTECLSDEAVDHLAQRLYSDQCGLPEPAPVQLGPERLCADMAQLLENLSRQRFQLDSVLTVSLLGLCEPRLVRPAAGRCRV